jgi:acetylornithine deacetylase/succinyl-diaminopimelate desuccinylase-like protein
MMRATSPNGPFLAMRLASVLLVCVIGSSAQPSADTAVAHVFAHPVYRQAADAIDRTFPQFVRDVVALTEIEAPPHAESLRAQACLELIRRAGLPEAGIDAEGNVVAFRPGLGGPLLVIAAHLDTVFPPGTDVRVRRDGVRLSAPGVGDNAQGVATVVALVRALTAARAKTINDLLFVADVGEEATGDLRGIRYLLTAGPYKGRVKQFVAIDGAGDGRVITTSAVGSRRYRVTFRGPGGHSFGSFGTVNPAGAMAGAIAAMNALQVPDTPRTTFNVGVLGGGTSVNTIPSTVWMDVDLRSESPVELSKLDQAFREIIRRATDAENRLHSVTLGPITATVDQVGFRPSGQTPTTSHIVSTTAAAIRLMNIAPVFTSASTDANLPISLGIPAITIDSGIPGDRPHAPDEWIEVDPRVGVAGLQRALLIVLSLAGLS